MMNTTRIGLTNTSVLVRRQAAQRAFSTSKVSMGRPHPHFAEGVYSNLPFKVKNRKYVPYWVLHWGFFATGFFAPFIIVHYQK